MKIKENITVYVCEHCGKKLFVKRAMEAHEKWCYKNPENDKACSACIHLEETEVSYDTSYDGYPQTRKAKAFKCKKLDKMLYPLIVEKKGLVEKYPETFENQQPMPRECEHVRFY